MPRFSDHDEYDEEMESAHSFEDEQLDSNDDSGDLDGDVADQVRANILAHLISSDAPNARQLARVFSRAMSGLEHEDNEEDDDDDDDDDELGHGNDEAELAPLLARLRSMRRRMFEPAAGSHGGHENDDFEELFGGGGNEVVMGPLGHMSRVRLARIGLTIQRHMDNENVIMDALNQLNGVLIMNSPEELASIIPSELVGALLEVLGVNVWKPELVISLLRAISHMLESSQSPVVRMFCELGLLDALHDRFQDIEYVDIAEQAVSILDRVVGAYPEQAIDSGCVTACMNYIHFFNLHIQKTIMSIVNQACTHITDKTLPAAEILLPGLMEQVNHSTENRDMSIAAICRIIISVDKRTGNDMWIEMFIDHKVREVLLDSITPECRNLPLVFKAVTVIARTGPIVNDRLFYDKFAEKIARSLTGSTLKGQVDSQQVLPRLLQAPKENLYTALQLLQQMYPYADKIGSEPASPFRRGPKPGSADISNVSADDEQTYKIVSSRLAIAIYSASTDEYIRQLVLTVLLQNCAHNGENLENVLDEIELSSFLSSVVSPNDVPAVLLVGGFDIAYELGRKFPHKCLSDFTRRGIVAKVDQVLASSKLLDPTSRYGIALQAVSERFKDLYTLHPEYAASVDGREAADLLSAIEQGQHRFSQLVQLVEESSPLELMNFGIFEALANFLADPSRRPEVIEAITPIFASLVSKAQDALSHSERLGVLSSSSSNTVQSLASALTRPVNIRLHVHGDPQRVWTLRVQGIAAVEAIEDFYRTRIFTESGRPNLFSVLADDHDMQTGHGTSESDEEDREAEEEASREHEDADGEVHGSNGTSAYQVSAAEVHHTGDMSFSEGEESVVSQPSVGGGEEEDEFADSESEDEGLHSGLGSDKSPKLYTYMEGHRVYRDMSVVGAVFQSLPTLDGDHVIPRSLWTEFFDITISETEIPAMSSRPQGVLGRGRRVRAETVKPNETPASFGNNAHFATAAKLLAALWYVNLENSLCPPRRFVNPNLTAKLNRQLEDPLVVVSSILPQWTIDIVRLYPFLFPFETRYLFVQSTSFGYSRCMSRWQTSGEVGELSDLGPQGALSSLQATAHAIARTGVLNNAGRPVKQKFRVKRAGLFSEFQSVFSKLGSSPAILDIEFFDEAGTGLGPTQEFYTKISREFASTKRNMWRGEDLNGYIDHPQGLYPKPFDENDTETLLVQKLLFLDLGRFVARALVDQRILDFRFNPSFFVAVLKSKGYLSSYPLSLSDIDDTLYQSLAMLRPEDLPSLDLNFVLPGNDDIELCAKGSSRQVTAENLDEYRDLVALFVVSRGIEAQINEFIAGFSQLLPVECLQALLPHEISRMFGHSNEDWSFDTLKSSIKVDHGYSSDSQTIQDLLALMTGFTLDERRAFLQFTTGSPNLPIGGFKALQPPFTVVLKHPDDESLGKDSYLPSVMTCANYLKLPDYSTRAVMAHQLRVAVEEGSDAFPLS